MTRMQPTCVTPGSSGAPMRKATLPFLRSAQISVRYYVNILRKGKEIKKGRNKKYVYSINFVM